MELCGKQLSFLEGISIPKKQFDIANNDNTNDFGRRLKLFGESNPWIEWEMNRLKNSIQPEMKQQES